MAARTGDEMSGPALLLAGFAVAGSAGEASALLAALTAASALGGPLLGVRLDRAGRPGRLLAVALALYAAGLLGVLLALDRLPLPPVLLLAAAAGLLGPALSGGWTAQLPRVAPGDRLARANALDAMTYGVAALAGPALAGAVAVAFGPGPAVLVAAGLIAVALPAAWTLPARTDTRHDRPAVRTELVAGFRVLTKRPALARATVVSLGSSAGQGMLAACLPLLGEAALGGASRGPLLLACTAVAALLANAALARRPDLLAPDAAVRVGALLQAAALALAATAHPLLLVAAAALAGLGEGPQLTGLFAVRHREAPDHLRSQIFTTGASLKITAFALGTALAGPLATRSAPVTLALAATLTAATALLPSPARAGPPRQEPAPDRASQTPCHSRPLPALAGVRLASAGRAPPGCSARGRPAAGCGRTSATGRRTPSRTRA
ncbi:MFS transporter [Kitasatospora cheerisanensis]|uniref:MFS transporter n=1 Tax=Kitasatospora cheerisanensis TaxID=81942 RepID=UPI00055FB15C|nr:MFS transporter [Kitasatospora cheerisanensis]